MNFKKLGGLSLFAVLVTFAFTTPAAAQDLSNKNWRENTTELRSHPGMIVFTSPPFVFEGTWQPTFFCTKATL